MIQRGSDTSFTNLWSLLLYIQSLLHYIENAQENKKNTILSYNIAENSKRVKRNEDKVCVCVCVYVCMCVFGCCMVLKKDRQHNGQNKKYKRTNNDLQNIHIKLKIE
jgi:uncharacterized protein YsxB (DUF464 family)